MSRRSRLSDFAAHARAYGATVTETSAFADAFAAKLPAVLHLKTSVDDILPGQSLSALAVKR